MAWFRRIREEFSSIILPFAGQPIVYVEVGVFGGDSAAWVCENVLTHPKSFGYGIDDYHEDEKRTKDEMAAIAAAAVKRLSAYPNFALIQAASHDVLRRWVRETVGDPIDVLYLDASHYAHDVLLDFCLAWKYLRAGSVVILDDYAIGKRKSVRHVPEACEAIKMAFGDLVVPFHEGPRLFAARVVSKTPPKEPEVVREPRGRRRIITKGATDHAP